MRRNRFFSWIPFLPLAAWLAACSSGVGVEQDPSLEVTVREPSGAPVANAAVEIQRNGSPIVRLAVTDEDGRVWLGEIEPGRYSLRILPPAGYSVAPEQENPLSVRLEEGVRPLRVVSFMLVEASL